MDTRGMRGRKMEEGSWEIMRKNRENCHKWKKLGMGVSNIASVGFRQRPSASADVRGHPRHVWAEDGGWKLRNYEEKQRKIP